MGEVDVGSGTWWRGGEKVDVGRAGAVLGGRVVGGGCDEQAGCIVGEGEWVRKKYSQTVYVISSLPGCHETFGHESGTLRTTRHSWTEAHTERHRVAHQNVTLPLEGEKS